ncbi:beta-lactamase family protein [Cellulomonas fimi]|uniref:serine hydrolase domain-containing protein n=1 Tax=Cellulomonas fimi TaxID=1708 RepID=UPI00234C7A1D|nr:serine hydrolase domain-containing protein [Cellulomonas fimi]MDC7120036.1 beta-lactamase family protein [Cellulomonas fimi]
MIAVPQAEGPVPAAVVLAVVVLALMAAVTVLAARARRPVLATGMTGDLALGSAVRDALPGLRAHRLAVALVEDGHVTFAGFGADERTVFEIGSVTKALTGLLLADAVDRGEVTLDDRLGEHLDLGGGAVAGVRLGDAAAHAGRLPRLPADPRLLLRGTRASLTGRNPYDGIDVPALLAAAARTPLATTPTPQYSNLGAALVGQALAARVGTTYAQLLADRVTGPLGMGATTTPAAARADDPMEPGTSRRGRPQEPWTMDGFAPAGGVRSTTADLAVLLAALLDGSAPGAWALDPRADLDATERVGLFWLTRSTDDGTTTWHNGMTGGFASFVGLDRAARRGVVVLSDVASSVDALGTRLLAPERV